MLALMNDKKPKYRATHNTTGDTLHTIPHVHTGDPRTVTPTKGDAPTPNPCGSNTNLGVLRAHLLGVHDFMSSSDFQYVLEKGLVLAVPSLLYHGHALLVIHR